MTHPENKTAGRREWLGLIVLTLPCLLIAMDLSVLQLAVPALSADLRPSGTELLWIVDVYGFTLAGSLITMGNLGDRIGRRRLLLIGAGAFGLTSIIAACSVDPAMLIAARALMGIAAATLMPSTLGLLRHMFADPRQRTLAIGIWATSLSLGGAIGPLAGGALLGTFRWGSVLLIAVPVMALLLVLGPVLLPEARNPTAAPVDARSAGLSLVAVLAGVFTLKHLVTAGIDARIGAPALLAASAGTAFLRRQRSLVHPLVDLRLFRSPAFSASLGANALGFGVLFGVDLLLVQYLQLVHGFSPLQAGLWTLPTFAGFIAGGAFAPLLLRRVRPASIISSGLALAAGALLILTQITATGGLSTFVAGTILLALGLAPVFTVATDTALGTAPPERAGAASAISETSTELGGALGIAVLGSLGTAIYRAAVTTHVPAGVPAHALTSARDSIGGAAATAEHLPNQAAATDLLHATREALISALHVTTGVSAALALAGAAVVALVLREPRVAPTPAIDPSDVPSAEPRAAIASA